MTVLDRLDRLQEQGALPRAAVGAVPDHRGASTTIPLHNRLPGTVLPIVGSSFLVDVAYPAETYHGFYPLSGVRTLSGTSLSIASRDDQMRYFEPASAVFLDTETTGLSLGTGTYVFLIGLGWLDGTTFRVRQYFLGRPSDEPAMLAALADHLSGFGTIVSFNGKAFDWPILESRYLYQRQPPPFCEPLHLDLLHAARRLWRRRLESCALGSLEASLLGVGRTRDDVPGWEIPSLYFHYQRTGDGTLLEGVFYHNLIDVLSLATLASHVARTISQPFDESRDALDWYSLGRLFDITRQNDLAIRCLEESLLSGLDRELRIDALTRLATIYRRDRRWTEAQPVWDRLVDEGELAAVWALVEAAKFHEHVERDCGQALDFVRNAMLILDIGNFADADEIRAGLNHRFARLIDKSMARSRRAQERT